MAQLIDGKKIAALIKSDIASRIKEVISNPENIPSLAVILVGNDPASEVYVRNKKKAANEVGMDSIQINLDAQISEQDLITKIQELNNNPKVHGILVQLPLPKHISSKNVINAIDPNKDVDGFHVVNVGKLATGQVGGDDGAMIPCTPLGCLHLLRYAVGSNLAGLKVLVIGTSNIVGRPLAQLLILEKCTVTIANSSTVDLKSECLKADVIISATGQSGLITANMVTAKTIVIDVGINRIKISDSETKLVGDVDFDGVKNIVSAITPVPGGVGPMTIAYLLKNTLECYLKSSAKSLAKAS